MAMAAEQPSAAMGPKNPKAPQNAALVPHQAQRAAQADGHCGNIGFMDMLPFPPRAMEGFALVIVATLMLLGPSLTLSEVHCRTDYRTTGRR